MRAKSLGLFLLVACLAFLLLFALAEAANQRLTPEATEVALPLVPAAELSGRYDWTRNGSLAVVSRDGGGLLPEGWRLFEVTSVGASFDRDPGETYLSLRCSGRPCIAGLSQHYPDLPAGEYTLEGEVYLENRAQEGTVSARLGWDGGGGVDPGAQAVHWSVPASQRGWQRVRYNFQHRGGGATVFVILDSLASDADCRVATVRLLGSPATAEVTTVAAPEATVPVESGGAMEVELRALYVSVHDLRWSGAEEIQAVIDRAAAAGFNAVYLQVRDLGYAYYNSAVEPRAPVLAASPGWDPLAEAVRRGHEAGLQVHAWVDMLPVWEGEQPPVSSAPDHMYNLFSARYGGSWLQGRAEGIAPDIGTRLYASPAHEQVRSYLSTVCRDIVSRYEVDGLHLSSLRYAGPDYGQDAASQDAFEKARAGRPTLTDADWRRGQVTALLAEVQREVREVRPQAQLSAGVWPVFEDRWNWQGLQGYGDLYEDSRGWAAGGYVDALMPELYVDSQYQLPSRVTAIVRDHLDQAHGRLVAPVLGFNSGSFINLAHAIALAREAGAGGVAIFSFGSLEQQGYWDDLAQGPFARPASVPPSPWKSVGRRLRSE